LSSGVWRSGWLAIGAPGVGWSREPGFAEAALTPFIAGLGAALAWTATTLCSSGSSRRIGAIPTLAWVVLFGIVMAAPFAIVAGWPPGLDGAAAALLVVVGTTNVAGLALLYTALRRGRVGVVASIVSTQGAIAALLAIATGERPGALTIAGFVPVVVGVALVTYETRESHDDPGAPLGTTVGLAACAATLFPVGLFAAGRASEDVPIGWVALPARVVGVAILLGALAVGVRPLVAIPKAYLAIATGLFEVVGILCFAYGAREGIAVTSVVSSQFAALSVVGAYFLFREHLRPRQVVGVAILAAGVGMVALGGA
jgi:drug/metabolite transporter (DMT)-like permease